MSFSPDERESTPDPRMSEACLNLDNQFLSMQELSKAEGMRVYARVRPMLISEIEAGFKECIASIDDQTVRAVVPSTSAKYRSTSHGTQDIIEDFTFTSAFGPEIGQFVLFEECLMNTMQNFIEGQNSLVFSYGSTGSGKTFTLQGNSENPGIIPLSLHLFFATLEDQLLKKVVVKPDKFADIIVLSETDRKKELLLKDQLLSISEHEEWSSKNSSKSFAMSLCDTFSEKSDLPERQTTLGPEEMAQAQAATLMKELSKKSAEQQSGVCNVWVSFAEIYNENVYDLLQSNVTQRSKLNLGEDKNGDVYVKGLQEICVSNCYEALKLLTLGQKNLRIASTKLNYQSSRSHCIFTVKVIRIPDPENITYAKVNRLSFCDLAGSERAAKSQTTGIRLKEAGCINTSLLVLGRCLEQLRSNPNLRDKKLIPFRESKLTRLFSGFFTGKGKAMMIINASPSELTFDETLHVLRFSAIAKELIINDSYIATASSTLQTITNMWTNARANRSNNSSDKSISFEDSMEELQEKDELIEKLLDLAESLRNNLEKEKKEKAELEIKIRQEVYQDYSKYSDELLENQKRVYEDECEAVKEIYKKRISSMEKMYENIIKGYKSQMDESESSEDDNYDVSKVGESEQKENKIDTSETSPEKLLEDIVKTETSENETDLEKKSDGLMTEIEALKKDLLNVTEELKATKVELQKVVDHATALESVTVELEKKLEVANVNLQEALNENDVLKKRNDYLQTSYQKEIMKLEEEKETCAGLLKENEIKDLKVKCDAAQLKLQSTLDKNEETLKEYEALKIDCVFYETDNKDLQKSKSEMEEKIKALLDELAVTQNEKQSIQEKLMEYENEAASHYDEIKKLNANIDELHELQNEMEAEYKKSLNEAEKKLIDVNNKLNAAYLKLEEEKNKADSLESDIASLKQNLVDLENGNNGNVETIGVITTELEDTRQENIDLKIKLADAEMNLTSQNESISYLKIEINELAKKKMETEESLLSNLKENAEAAEVLEAANKALNYATMMTEERDKKIQSLQTECEALKYETAELKEKYTTTTKDLADLASAKKDLEDKYSTSNENYDNLMRIKKDLEEKYAISTNELADFMRLKEKAEQKYDSATRQLEIKKATETKEEIESFNTLHTVQEQAKDISSLTAECMHLKEEISALQKINIDLNNELSSAHESLNLEKTALNKRIEESEKIILEYKENIMNLENEVANLKIIYQNKDELRENIEKELNEAKEKLVSTSQELNNALENIQKQSEEIDSLKTEITLSENCISELKEEEIKLKEHIMNLSDSIELNEAKEKLVSTSQELNNALENIQKQSEEIDSLKAEITLSKNCISELKEKEIKLKEHIMNLSDSIELNEAKEKLVSTSQELNNALENIQKQSEEIDSLKTEITSSKNCISELKEEEIKLKEHIMNLSDSIESQESSHKQQLDTLNAKLEEGLNVISKQEKELEVVQNDFNNQKNETTLLLQQKLDLEEKLNSQPQIALNVDLDSLNARLIVALDTIDNQQKDLENFQKNCATYKEDISQLELLKKDLQEKLNSQPQMDDLALKMIQMLEDCEMKATHRINSLEERAELDKCCINECEKECDYLRREVNILQSIECLATTKIKTHHSSSIRHVEQIMDLEKIIKTKEISIVNLENDYTMLQKQYKDFQVSSKKQLHSEKQKLTTEIEDMKKFKKDIEKENKELKSKLTQLEQEKDKLSKEAETLKTLQNELLKRKSDTPQLDEEDKQLKVENVNDSTKRAWRGKPSTPQLDEEDKQSKIENVDDSPKRASRRKPSTPQLNEEDKQSEVENVCVNNSPKRTSRRKPSTPQVELLKKSENENINSQEKGRKEKIKLKSSTNKTQAGKNQKKGFSKKADNIEENQKQKENVNQTRTTRTQKKICSKEADIKEIQKQEEKANQTEKKRKSSGENVDINEENQKDMNKKIQKENANQEKKITRKQLGNLENVPVDVDLGVKKDFNPVKSKSSKRKVQDNSFEEKSPLNKTLKKLKLNDGNSETFSKPQNLRLQVLTGKIVKNETSQPSPRLTRGRKRLFNSELFQSKENVLENRRRAVRW